jgi:predicted Zn-dependent protease
MREFANGLWYCLALLPLTMPVAAQNQQPITWSGVDATGRAMKLPGDAPVTIVLFVRVDQEQSQQAITHIRSFLSKNANAASVVAVVTGEEARDAARRLSAQKDWAWPIAVDQDRTLCGAGGVHAWPTTVVLRRDGTVAGRIAGINDAYARLLEAYVDLAAGKLDEAGLRAKLDGHATVGADDAAQSGARHLKVAQRLLERGMVEQSKVELSVLAAHPPQDAEGRMALADALLIVGQPKEALGIIEGLADATKGPSWQVDVLRGRALVALERWDEAREILTGAAKRATAPAEAWYELGRVYQHAGEAERAAVNFKAAFEATAEGKRLNPQGPIQDVVRQNETK